MTDKNERFSYHFTLFQTRLNFLIFSNKYCKKILDLGYSLVRTGI